MPVPLFVAPQDDFVIISVVVGWVGVGGWGGRGLSFISILFVCLFDRLISACLWVL